VLGVNIDKIQKALKSFSGISRRLEVMGKYSNKEEDIILIDDYGHHPTEIRNTVNAIKEMWPHRTITLIFQPHRFSRTKDLLEQYINVLSDVDFLYLLDIYAAGEVAIEGIESKILINKLHDYSPNFKGTYIENKGDLMTKITISELNNDVLLVMGAGSIGSYAADIHTLLSNKLNK
jgi:UDP-N-acetylmuramate--alanine ligase